MATKRKTEQQEPEPKFRLDETFIARIEGHREGRQEAEQRAAKEIILRTPQSLLMATKEGMEWLDNNPVARLANDVAHHYFDIAGILARATSSTKSLREWAEQEVLSCARAWMIPPDDTAVNRLRVFLWNFAQTLHQYRSAREIYTRPIAEDKLPKDPWLAEARRQEIERRRTNKLLPDLAPNLAEQLARQFLRFYPDERGKIHTESLSKAIEAFGCDTGKAGRKPKAKKGQADGEKTADGEGKFHPLERALKKTSFGRTAAKLEGPVRKAIKAEREHRERRAEAEKKRLSEPWDPPEHFASRDDE